MPRIDVLANKQTGLREFVIDWEGGATSIVERGSVVLNGSDGKVVDLGSDSIHYRDCRRVLTGAGYRNFKPRGVS